MTTERTLHYVGHLGRSNPEMFWRVNCPFTVGKRPGISFFYFATIEEVLAKYPQFTDCVPEIPS